jgi:methylmalonyl-CoA mutase N-terminal domain/subunit
MLEGVIGGLDSGWFQGEIADSSYELEKRLEDGRRVVVGVNRFTDGGADEIDILQITAEQEQTQIKRLQAVKADRDGEAVAQALTRLGAEAADPEVNLMPALVDAVRTYATEGEIIDALAAVFGRHVETPMV